MINNSFANCSLDQKIASYGTANLASKSVMIISAVATIALPIFKNFTGLSWIATGGLIGLSAVVLLASAAWTRFIDYRLKPYQWTAQALEQRPNLERIQAAIYGANAYGKSETNIQQAFLTFLNVPRATNELSWEAVVEEHSIDFKADDIIKMLPPQSDESGKSVDRKVVQITKKDMTPVLFTITNLSSRVLTSLQVTFNFIDKFNDGRGPFNTPKSSSRAFNVTAENPLQPNQTVEIRASNLHNGFQAADVRILELVGMDASEELSQTNFHVYSPNEWSNQMTLLDPEGEFKDKVTSSGTRILSARPT